MDLILAGIFGAILAGGGKILLELYKRHDDRRGVAAAIAGEISGILFSATTRNLPAYFTNLVPLLKLSNPPNPLWVYYDENIKPTPVLDAYLKRIGSLGGRFPERVAQFYTLYNSIIVTTRLVAGGSLNAQPVAAALQIEGALGIWARASADGKNSLMIFSHCVANNLKRKKRNAHACYQNADQAVKKLHDPVALTGPWTTWQSFGLMNSAHTAQMSLVALS
jgi:hypothetical protein